MVVAGALPRCAVRENKLCACVAVHDPVADNFLLQWLPEAEVAKLPELAGDPTTFREESRACRLLNVISCDS